MVPLQPVAISCRALFYQLSLHFCIYFILWTNLYAFSVHVFPGSEHSVTTKAQFCNNTCLHQFVLHNWGFSREGPKDMQDTKSQLPTMKTFCQLFLGCEVSAGISEICIDIRAKNICFLRIKVEILRKLISVSLTPILCLFFTFVKL